MPAAMDVVEVHVEAQLKKLASEALKNQGLTLDDAVQQMLTYVVEKGSLQFAASDAEVYSGGDKEYDAWFRSKVQEALEDPRPPLSATEARERMKVFRSSVAGRTASR